MRGSTIQRIAVGVVLAATLALAGCGKGGLGASQPKGAPPAAASAPISASAAVPSTAPATEAPASSDPIAGPPTGDSSAAPAVTTAPSWPAAVAGTFNVDFTKTGAKGVMRTQVTVFECNNEPVSGIYLEGPGNNNAPPYGDVPIGTNAYKQVQVTHHVPTDSDSYIVNLGCGYADGGDHDWKFAFNDIWISPGRKHTITCTTANVEPYCVLDGIQRVAG